MPPALAEWFRHHYYITLLLATMVEGLGLPLPAEVLFLAIAALVHSGSASLASIILLAALGNLIGTLTGFGLAYMGGKRLIRRIFRRVGIKAAAIHQMEEFFQRYGPATVLISRFVGPIRAATIYSAGAARMKPLPFAGYALAAALIWNGAWAYVAYRFGRHLQSVAHTPVGRTALYVAAALATVLLIPLAVRWYRRSSMDL